jgi:hypothetical protein
VTEAEQERLRIMEIIQGRIDIHSHFIEYYMDQEVEPPKGVLGALSELHSLKREIERESK